MTAPLFPLFIDLRGRTVLVVGGGPVARRKVAPLLAAGARVRVGAPVLGAALQATARRTAHRISAGRIRSQVWLDWRLAGDRRHRRRRRQPRGRRRRRSAGHLGERGGRRRGYRACHMPARIERGPLQMAISSGGGAPMLARHLRERLETELDESLGDLAELLAQARGRIRARYPRLDERRRFFDDLLSGPIPGLLRQGQTSEATQALDEALAPTPRSIKPGSVALVGAGPGDPGLLTLRALAPAQPGRRDPARPPGQQGRAATGAARRRIHRSGQAGRAASHHAGAHPRADARARASPANAWCG